MDRFAFARKKEPKKKRLNLNFKYMYTFFYYRVTNKEMSEIVNVRSVRFSMQTKCNLIFLSLKRIKKDLYPETRIQNEPGLPWPISNTQK